MFESLNRFLGMRGLPPHGYCLLWDPALVWTHVVADAIIAIAYFSIPFALWRFIRARPDIDFGWMLGLFATFILACGTTHLINIYVLWVPAYGIEAAVKVVTAAASIATAALLIPLLPKLIQLPSPAQLRAVNQQLINESREREKTAEMLRQSQKMEAIGRLTGGVAHDFNNLLQVVIGNLERAQRQAGASDPKLDRALGQALSGAERAAVLTDQLLGFARRQPLKLRALDLREVEREIGPLIERAVSPGIEYSCNLGEAGPILADLHQLENALLNLVLNSCDAMPDGGELRITARPGPDPSLVELCVEDTGKGMDPATLELATDPFFTTKEVGKGTGLGLSQVYGTMQQVGGDMKLESSPGNGTRVRLFFPIASSAAKGVV